MRLATKFPVIYAPGLLRWWSKLNGWNVGAFTIPFIILTANKESQYPSEFGKKWFRELLNHEYIHIAQHLDFALVLLPAALIVDLFVTMPLWVGILMYLFASCSFFVWYLIDYLYNRWVLKMDHFDAYANITFEREAYTMEEIPEYLDQRPFWGWLYT